LLRSVSEICTYCSSDVGRCWRGLIPPPAPPADTPEKIIHDMVSFRREDIQTQLYVYMSIYVEMCKHVYMYEWIYTNINTYIYVHTYTYTHIYIHISIPTHIRVDYTPLRANPAKRGGGVYVHDPQHGPWLEVAPALHGHETIIIWFSRALAWSILHKMTSRC